MMNNNKILTVSYGTFSCTLEGFDDSFGTMKAIAEYFRDLAADDRYFGAEPPQPDAEMLARIAEREVSRRVEAREHDGQILLKAHEDAVAEDATPGPEPASAEAPAVSHDAVQPPVTDSPENASEAPVQAETPEAARDLPEHADVAIDDTETPDAAQSDEGVEEAAAPADDAPVEADDSVELDPLVEAEVNNDDAAEDQPLDETDQTETLEDPDASDGEATDVAAVHDVADAEAFFADSPSVTDAEPEVDPDVDLPVAFSAFEAPMPKAEAGQGAASDSIAAKLQRIREVVSQQDDQTDDEDVTAEEDEADIEDIPLDTVAEVEQETADAEQSELETAAQEIEGAFEVDDQIAMEAAAEEVEDQIAIESEAREIDDIAAVLSRLEDAVAEAEDELIEPEEDAGEDEIDENLFEEIDDDEEAHAEPAEASTEQQVEDVPPVKGRVLKVDRADLEAALEAGDLEEFQTDTPAALSAADEEELQRELDALAAEAAGTEDEPTAKDLRLPPIDANAAEDVSRLMAEADQHMEEPEGATRRSAFAHLRAAVAARFADKTMQEDDPEEETTKPYRSDLAQVVKPRRPVPSGARTERPSEPQPTPLKLVAEQRIDADAPSGGDPVTPRRVAATLEDDLEFAQDTGFAEFAEEMGATKLPDVLEAAAAYLSFVEGYEQFTRPQLMTRVRQADCGDFSREDGLRSFGQLLRAGKIEKITGGRFTASEAIRFKPDERAAS